MGIGREGGERNMRKMSFEISDLRELVGTDAFWGNFRRSRVVGKTEF